MIMPLNALMGDWVARAFVVLATVYVCMRVFIFCFGLLLFCNITVSSCMRILCCGRVFFAHQDSVHSYTGECQPRKLGCLCGVTRRVMCS